MEAAAPHRGTITGVVLAGGRARRLGGQDKGLVEFAGRPLVEWVIEGIAPQVGHVLINANRNGDRYAKYGFSVIKDEMEGFQGPLAGFAGAMAAASTPWILTLPCDGPFPHPNLAERLGHALVEQNAEIAVAADGERMQPVYALLPVTLLGSLTAFLNAGERKIDRWYARHRTALADFRDRPECFANINSAEDVLRLEQVLAP